MKYGTIYKITNMLNGKAYVGVTTKTIQERFDAHLNRAVKERSAIQKALKKYGKENFEIIEIDTAISEQELFEKEKFWIAHFNTFSKNGYNLTEGGGGIVNMSQEMRDRISKKKKGVPCLKQRGKTISKEQRISISRTLGASQVKGTNLTTGEIILLDYPRQGKEFGFNPSLICAVINGKRNHHKGYTFEYINHANQNLIAESNESAAVQRIASETLNGNII